MTIVHFRGALMRQFLLFVIRLMLHFRGAILLVDYIIRFIPNPLTVLVLLRGVSIQIILWYLFTIRFLGLTCLEIQKITTIRL